MIGFVLPTLGESARAVRAMEAVRRSTTQPHRVVVVQDDPTARRGCYAAMNEGAHALRPHDPVWLFFLHDDTTLDEGAVDEAVRVAESSGTAVFGLSCRRPDGVADIGLSLDSDLRPVVLRAHPKAASGAEGEEVLSVPAVITAAALIRADVFHQLGGFTERLVDHFGEVDFCLRAGRAGHRIASSLRVMASHEGGASGLTQTELRDRDLSIFLRRWTPALRISPCP